MTIVCKLKQNANSNWQYSNTRKLTSAKLQNNITFSLITFVIFYCTLPRVNKTSITQPNLTVLRLLVLSVDEFNRLEHLRHLRNIQNIIVQFCCTLPSATSGAIQQYQNLQDRQRRSWVMRVKLNRIMKTWQILNTAPNLSTNKLCSFNIDPLGK